MLTIKTIPVLSRMISKLDIIPLLNTLKSADIFTDEDIKNGRLSGDKAVELGVIIFGDIAPQLGTIGEDIPEFVEMYYNIDRIEAEQKDFFEVLQDIITDEGIRHFFDSALKRKVEHER